jgi:hypothetical protein
MISAPSATTHNRFLALNINTLLDGRAIAINQIYDHFLLRLKGDQMHTITRVVSVVVGRETGGCWFGPMKMAE